MKKSFITAATGLAFSVMLAGGLATAQEKKETADEEIEWDEGDPIEWEDGNPFECDELPKYDPETTSESAYIREIQKFFEAEVVSDMSIYDAAPSLQDSADYISLYEILALCSGFDLSEP